MLHGIDTNMYTSPSYSLGEFHPILVAYQPLLLYKITSDREILIIRNV